MNFARLETVVLNRDLPEHELRVGDLGAIVDVQANDALIVEFVLPSGGTRALVTLQASDIRAVRTSDVLSVRAG